MHTAINTSRSQRRGGCGRNHAGQQVIHRGVESARCGAPLKPCTGGEVIERALVLQDLLEADEAFLTSSLRGIAPLVRVGDAAIATGTPGALTMRLRAAYTALIARECGV